MRAKQLMYTSWGRGSGAVTGFRIYSQSEGISEEDSKMIVASMSYKPMSSLPYSPTADEIETLFPRNVAFFTLPSGKYCLAQSAYLGADHSGVRLGNYLIHAYVFDTRPDCNPLSFVHSDAFKRTMTKDELNPPTNPEPLPEVEVTGAQNGVTQNELSAFFTPEKKANLEYLLQAVINASVEGKSVFLYDDYKNLVLWLKAIECCLPKEFASNVTFTSYPSISSRVLDKTLVQCIVPKTFYFDYTRELAAGKLVFNMRDNQLNRNVAVGGYVKDVVRAFADDMSAVQKITSGIGAYLPEAQYNFNVAIDLMHFYSADRTWFKDSATLLRLVSLVEKGGKLNGEQIAEILTNIVGGNPNFPARECKELYGYIFRYSDEATKEGIIQDYVATFTQKNVVGQENNMDSYFETIVQNAAFTWDYFLQYVQNRLTLDGYVRTYQADDFMLYVLCKTVFGTASSLSDSEKQRVATQCLAMQVQKRNLKMLTAFLRNFGANGGAYLDAVIADVSRADASFLSARNCPFLFSLMEETQNFVDFNNKLLLQIIVQNGEVNELIDAYVAYAAKHPQAVEKFEIAYGNDCNVRKFISATVTKQLVTSRNVSLDQITKFFNTVYAVGDDTAGNFQRVLENFLKSKTADEQIRAALKWYCTFKIKNVRDSALFDILEKFIFGQKFETFYKAYAEKANREVIEEFYKAMQSMKFGYAQPEVYAAMSRGNSLGDLKNANVYKENVDAVYSDSVFKGATGEFAKETLAGVGACYAENILSFYAKYVDEKKETQYIVRSLLEPLAKANVRFADKFADCMSQKWKLKAVGKYLVPILLYACPKSHQTEAVRMIVEKYFDAIGTGKVNQLAKLIQSDNTIKTNEEVFRFMSDYVRSHKRGLFSRLFGKSI